MQRINNLTCNPLNLDEDEIPLSEILDSDNPTGKFVQGNVLQGVFKHGVFYIVLMTDGFDYEEFVALSLLNENLCVLDLIIIGEPSGAPGNLEYIEIEAHDLIKFNFQGNIWSVEITQKPLICLMPWLPTTADMRRPWDRRQPFWGFSKHLLIKKKVSL